MELFYEYPQKRFTIRELAKKTKIPKSTVQKYLTALKKQNLVTPENQASNLPLFKFKKRFFFIEKIIKSGLISMLVEELNPSCIILFGSVRKGESEKESDIDLFIETQRQKELDLNKYEKKLKHKVQLFVEDEINNLPENLWHNVINGIKLFGFLRLKK